MLEAYSSETHFIIIIHILLSPKVYLCAGFPHQNMAIVNKPKSYHHSAYTRNRSGSTARAVCFVILIATWPCTVHCSAACTQRRMPSGCNASFVAYQMQVADHD